MSNLCECEMTEMNAALEAAGVQSPAEEVARLDEQVTLEDAMRVLDLCTNLGYHECSLLLAQSRWGWEAYALSLSACRPSEKPTAKTAAALSDAAALAALALAGDSAVLRSEARRRWPTKSKTLFVVTPACGILAGGTLVQCRNVPEALVGTSVPVIPLQGGWLEVSEGTHGWVKSGIWYDNETYQAVNLLRCHTRGLTYISPDLVATFQLHPTHNFARFFIQIANGNQRSDFQVTLSPPGQRSLPARHFTAINLLTELAGNYPPGCVPANLQVPDKAFWVDMEPAKSVAGKFRLQRCAPGYGQECALVLHVGHNKPIQLLPGMDPSEIADPMLPATARKGACVVWHKEIRNGRRQTLSYATLVLMPVGSFIQCGGEWGVTFDGSLIAKALGREVD